MHPKGTGHKQSHQGGNQTGHNGGVVHNAHADHLHGEHGGGERSAEQTGEGGSHATHHQQAAVFGIQPDLPADPRGQRAAQLKGGALPSGGAAHQMGEDRGDKNQGGGTQAHGFCVAHSHQNQVGAQILLHPAYAVQQDDCHAPQGQEPDDPGVKSAELCGDVDAPVEGHGHQSGDDPHVPGV